MRRYLTHPLTFFIVILHGLFFLLAWHFHHPYLVDSYGYLNQAKNIVAHHSWYAENWNAPLLPDYFTIRPPLYAFFIVACKGIIASDLFVLAVQNVLSMLSFFMLWRLLEQAAVQQKYITRSIVLALLLYPSQLIYANLVMTEIVFQVLLTGVFYCAVQAYRKPSFRIMLIMAVLLSLAMLTKPVIFLFGIVLFVFFTALLWKTDKKILLPFILLPLTWHALCLQNQRTTGYYHYSSIKIMADLRVNAKYILSHKYGEDSSSAFVTQVFNEADAMPDYAARYQHIQQRCNDVYVHNGFTFMFLYVKGMVATLIDPGRFDLSVFFGLQNNTQQGFLHRLNTEGISAVPDILKHAPVLLLLYLLLILSWNILLCATLLFFLVDRNTDALLRIIVLLFVGYIVSVTGISGLCRYRVPVYPVLIFAFACVLPAWSRYRQTKRHA